MNVVSISLSKLKAQILCPLRLLFFFFLINMIDRVLFLALAHTLLVSHNDRRHMGKKSAKPRKNNNIKPKKCMMLTKSVSCKWVRECFNTYGNAFRKNKFAIVIFNSAVNRSTSFFFPYFSIWEKRKMNSVCERIGCHIDTLPWIILNISNFTCCSVYSVDCK